MHIFLRLALLSTVLALAAGAIPSRGRVTTSAERASLKPSDYEINPAQRGVTLNTPSFRAALAELPNFPALATADVQHAVATIELFAGKKFPRHYHPRGAELLTVTRGRARVTFTMEDGRKVSNVIHSYKSTVVPQGLLHEIKCVSKFDCKMVAALNTADPGTIFV